MQTKRDHILATSLTVFQEETLKGARMERIAQVANVSKRSANRGQYQFSLEVDRLAEHGDPL